MLKRNLIANYLGQGWTALMGLAFIPLYIKYLGIEAYGLIGLFGVLQAWLGLLDMGMTPTLGREMARFTGGSHSNESIRDLLRSIEIIAVAVAMLIAGGIALSANWIATDWLRAETLPTEVVAQAFAIMGLVTALRFVEGIYRSTIVGLQRQVLFNVVNSLMATLRGLGAVGILIWVSPTIEAFFLWQGVVSIATLVILGITTYRCMPTSKRGGRFSLDSLRGVWRFAGGMMGITLLALLLTQVDKILLSKLLTLSEFGYYTLATTVAGAMFILTSPITQAFYPRFCKQHSYGDTAILTDSFHKGAQLVSIIAGSSSFMIILFSETLLQLWTQNDILAQHTSPLLSVLALGVLLNLLFQIPNSVILASGNIRLGIYSNVIAIVFIVPMILIVVPQYGAMGGAWVWVALNTGYILITMQFMFRSVMTTEKWNWYIKDVLNPLVMIVVVLGLIKILWYNPDTTMEKIVILGFSTLAAVSMSIMVTPHVRNAILFNFYMIKWTGRMTFIGSIKNGNKRRP